MQILDKGVENDRASLWCDRFITVLVLLNVMAVVLESVASLRAAYGTFFSVFEAISLLIFSVEYLLRWWSNGARYPDDQGVARRGRREYIFGFHGIVDFMATVPFFLQWLVPGLDMRVLRALRLIRVLKLSHYSSAIEDLFSAIRAEARSFFATLYILLIAILFSSTLMYFAESDLQPDKFASIPDAIYWAVITLTTVGYGDVSPVTWVGKIISIITAFLGVCTVALLTGIVASAFSNQLARRKVIFEAELREALADGVLSDQERRQLESLKAEFNLSDEQVQALMAKVGRELKS
jgi:voltage-gated potassium channel